MAYERQVQCAACTRWRPWAQAYDPCPLCGLRLGTRDRLALSPATALLWVFKLGVPEQALVSLRATFRKLIDEPSAIASAIQFSEPNQGVRS